jgi:hypothetical protein
LVTKVKKKEVESRQIKDIPVGNIYGGNYSHQVNYYDAYVREYLGYQGNRVVESSLPQIIDPNCYIGIEVEVENVPRFNEDLNNFGWQLHDDSSLRNSGREFVSFPLRGQQIPLALELLFKHVFRPGYEFSKRTSVHIHMNVRNLTPTQITAIVCLFTVFEKVLYRFVGHDRDKNIFCVPLQQTLISNALLDAMSNGFKNHRWYKYSGLNLLPVYTQGSIEFRQLYGTDNTELICTWINLLQRIRSYAAENSLDQILEEIKALNTNSQYDFFVQKVFATEMRFLDLSNLAEDIESGVICVKQCTLNNAYHQTILSEVTSDSPLVAIVLAKVVKRPETSMEDVINTLREERGPRATLNSRAQINAGQWLNVDPGRVFSYNVVPAPLESFGPLEVAPEPPPVQPTARPTFTGRFR